MAQVVPVGWRYGGSILAERASLCYNVINDSRSIGEITMTDQPFSATTATQDDKVVAALAHALGLLTAIIVWATHRNAGAKEPET